MYKHTTILAVYYHVQYADTNLYLKTGSLKDTQNETFLNEKLDLSSIYLSMLCCRGGFICYVNL